MQSPETTLFGRSAILARLSSLIDERPSHRSGRLVRIVGAAGYGKTAILNAFAEEHSKRAGTLVLQAGATTEDSARSGFLLKRLLRDGVRVLGSLGTQYASGLERLFEDRSLSADGLELGSVRFVEALCEDYRLLLIVDDVQWADDVSILTLARIVQRSPHAVALVVASRADDAIFAIDSAAVDLVKIGGLDLGATKALVLDHYPGAEDGIAETLARCSAGVPMVAIALAQQAKAAEAKGAGELAVTLGEAIRADLEAMPPASRDIVSLCAMLREPISYPMLCETLGTTTVEASLAAVVPRYLEQVDGGFRFAHALLREGVGEACRSSAPLQTKALASIQRRATPSLNEMRDACDLARSLGDSEACFRSLIALARRCVREKEWILGAQAFAAAFSLRSDADASLASDYLEYANVMRLLERHHDVVEFLEPILVSTPAFKDRALVAATLANALWSLDRPEAAVSVCDRYLANEADPDERAELSSVRLNLLVLSGNTQLVSSPGFEELIATGNARVAARLLGVRAFIRAREGNHQAMLADLAALTGHQGFSATLPSHYIRDTRLVCDWNERGVPAVRDDLLVAAGGAVGSLSHQLAFLTLVDFAAGNWDLALQRFDETSLDRFSKSDRDRMLIPCAAILALGGRHEGIERAVAQRAEELLALGQCGEAGEIVLWHSLLSNEGRAGDRFGGYIANWLEAKKSVEFVFYPIECVVGFVAAKYPEVRKAITFDDAAPRSPWFRANYELGRGWLERRADLLLRAANRFRALGASALADLADRAALTKTEPYTLRADAPTAIHASNRSRDALTPREREVCNYVAHGMTNRAIAQRLFLSERTVATHVASALSKYGAKTRTELARRIMREA